MSKPALERPLLATNETDDDLLRTTRKHLIWQHMQTQASISFNSVSGNTKTIEREQTLPATWDMLEFAHAVYLLMLDTYISECESDLFYPTIQKNSSSQHWHPRPLISVSLAWGFYFLSEKEDWHPKSTPSSNTERTNELFYMLSKAAFNAINSDNVRDASPAIWCALSFCHICIGLVFSRMLQTDRESCCFFRATL